VGALAGLMLGALAGLMFFGTYIGAPLGVALSAAMLGWPTGMALNATRRQFRRENPRPRELDRARQRLEAHRAMAALGGVGPRHDHGLRNRAAVDVEQEGAGRAT
jgi:hypothetical protein